MSEPIIKISARRGSGRSSVVTYTVKFPNSFMYSETVEVDDPKDLVKLLEKVQKKANDGNLRHSELQHNEAIAMSKPDFTE